MERSRFEEIEAFVRRFTGPADRTSQAYRMECLSEASTLLSQARYLGPEEASDYSPHTSLLLWLAETIIVVSDDGGKGATTTEPTPVLRPFGMTSSASKSLQDIVFDRLAERYPFLLAEFQKCRDSFLS